MPGDGVQGEKQSAKARGTDTGIVDGNYWYPPPPHAECEASQAAEMAGPEGVE